MGFKKADIQFHVIGYAGNPVPAINVKVYHGQLDRVKLPLEEGQYSDDGGVTWQTATTDPEFTHEWIDGHINDDRLDVWSEVACRDGFEMATDEAKSIFKDHKIEVWAEGRSGGWLVVDGLPDVESWDALMVHKWAQLVKACEASVDDIPRAIVCNIYYNVFLPWQEERDAKAADDAAAVLPIDVSV